MDQSVIPQLQWLDENRAVAGQLHAPHIAIASSLGFRSVICNRPDHETEDHPVPHQRIAQSCTAHGLLFAYHPVDPNQHTEQDAKLMRALLADLPEPILIYCRSGRRSKALIAKTKTLAFQSPELQKAIA